VINTADFFRLSCYPDQGLPNWVRDYCTESKITFRDPKGITSTGGGAGVAAWA